MKNLFDIYGDFAVFLETLVKTIDDLKELQEDRGIVFGCLTGLFAIAVFIFAIGIVIGFWALVAFLLIYLIYFIFG